jgi:hypothetical protein
MKLSSLKVDPMLTERGDWVGNIPNLPGIRIKARGTNNTDYRKMEAQLVREIPKADRLEGVSPQDQDRIAGTLLLKTVVLDVEGLTEDDGTTPIKYTAELGAALLLDPQYREFQAGAAYAGGIVAQRATAATEEDAKNSPTS